MASQGSLGPVAGTTVRTKMKEFNKPPNSLKVMLTPKMNVYMHRDIHRYGSAPSDVIRCARQEIAASFQYFQEICIKKPSDQTTLKQVHDRFKLVLHDLKEMEKKVIEEIINLDLEAAKKKERDYLRSLARRPSDSKSNQQSEPQPSAPKLLSQPSQLVRAGSRMLDSMNELGLSSMAPKMSVIKNAKFRSKIRLTK